MKIFSAIFFSLLLISKLNAQVLAGPYAPPVGQLGTTAIHKDSLILVDWAISSTLIRGWQNVTDTALGLTTTGNNISPTDKSGLNGVASLGDGGSATLTFGGYIYDGIGPDFAVFENSFDGLFLELAFVEVSSDGINFFRFDAISLIDTTIQTGTFGNTDATEIHNLAGKYQSQYGTPFDLNELSGTPGLNINQITHVRVIDVIGNIQEPFSNFDSQNRAVNDPWPTPFPTGGFDLDAVGVINFTPTSIDETNKVLEFTSFPNPATDKIFFQFQIQKNYNYKLIDISGKIISTGKIERELDISQLNNGIYFIHVYSSTQYAVKKIVKQ